MTRLRYTSTVIGALAIVVGISMAHAAKLEEMQEGHCRGDQDLEVVTGSWVSGLHGAGIDWGDPKKGHSSGIIPLREGHTLKVWYDKAKPGDRHVLALGIDDKIVAGTDASDPMHVPPTETFPLKPGDQIHFRFWTAHDHPDIRAVWVTGK